MAISAQEMIAAIEETLAELYRKRHKSLSIGERTAVMQDIADLERSLARWQRIAAREDGARPRVATIDLRDA